MNFLMTTRYGPSDRVRTCGLMVPNHPRYQLRHTRLYYFILYCYTYWISAFNPRRFPQKHSRGSSLEALAPLLVSSPRSNTFIRHRRRHSSSPNCATPGCIILFYIATLIGFLLSIRGASLRNIVAALRPTEGQTPQKPFKFTRDILPFLARFVNLKAMRLRSFRQVLRFIPLKMLFVPFLIFFLISVL